MDQRSIPRRGSISERFPGVKSPVGGGWARRRGDRKAFENTEQHERSLARRVGMKKQAFWAAAALLAVAVQVYLLEARGEPAAPIAEAAPLPNSKDYAIPELAVPVKALRGSTQPPRSVPLVRRLQE